MANKVGRPRKENRDEIVKFQKVSMHIPTYNKLKQYSIKRNKHMVDVLDEIIDKNVL